MEETAEYYKNLLKRYMKHVGISEGETFIPTYVEFEGKIYEEGFSEEECKLLQSLDDEINKR